MKKLDQWAHVPGAPLDPLMKRANIITPIKQIANQIIIQLLLNANYM